MALRLLGHVELPANQSSGGFDHADIHPPTDRLYVAHTSNDSIDVIDCARDRYVESMPGFAAVAGALVSEARGLVFTSNRGENTVSVFEPGAERDAFKVRVGVKPNGLAFDAARGILVAANVGDLSLPDSHTVSIVDIARRERIAEFLLLNPEFPRSVRFAAAGVESALRSISQMTARGAGGRPERLAGRLHASLDYGQVDEILSDDPHAYLEGIERHCAQIHAALHQSYIGYPIEEALPA